MQNLLAKRLIKHTAPTRGVLYISIFAHYKAMTILHSPENKSLCSAKAAVLALRQSVMCYKFWKLV